MVARRLLAHPAFWPEDAELERVALSRGVTKPARSAALGSTLLLAVDRENVVASAYTLGRTATDETPFVGRARASLDHGYRIALRDLPFLGEAAVHLAPPSLHATLEHVDGPAGRAGPSSLGGSSFGLSMCLAHASLLLELPLSPTLVASVAIEHDGSLTPVDDAGLRRKIELVVKVALGVSSFLVHADQREVAERVVADLALRPLRIVPISSLSEALRVAFPDLEASVQRRWSDPACAISGAHALFRMALHGNPLVLNWGGVASSAGAVLQALDAADPSAAVARREAHIAQAIARRHAGHAAPLAWPRRKELKRLYRPHRALLLAHVVQAAADADDELARRYARRGRRALPARAVDRDANDHKLLGAVGRAYAACGRYKRALRLLQATVAGWLAIDLEHEASYALCELLRLAGVLQRADLVAELRAHAVPAVLADARTSQTSRAYVVLALGRAHALVGEHALARDVLEDSAIEWGLTPGHVLRSRLQWLARALRGLGELDLADQAVERLSALDHAAPSVFLLLARLDSALATDAPTDELVAELAREPDMARLLQRCEGEPARFLTTHARY